MSPFIIIRLFNFYRRSGMSIIPALKRAIETWSI
jgi:hypothetical protein